MSVVAADDAADLQVYRLDKIRALERRVDHLEWHRERLELCLAIVLECAPGAPVALLEAIEPVIADLQERRLGEKVRNAKYRRVRAQLPMLLGPTPRKRARP